MFKRLTSKFYFNKESAQQSEDPSTPSSNLSETFSSQNKLECSNSQNKCNKRINHGRREFYFNKQDAHQHISQNEVNNTTTYNENREPQFHFRKSSLPPPEIQLQNPKQFISASQQQHRSLSIECKNKHTSKPSLPLDFKQNRSAFTVVHQTPLTKKEETQNLITEQFSATQQSKEQQTNNVSGKNSFFTNTPNSKLVQCSKPTIQKPLAVKPVNPFYLARKYYNPLFAPNLMMLRNSCANMCEQPTPNGQEQTPDYQDTQQDNVHFENSENIFRFRLHHLNNSNTTTQNFYDYDNLASQTQQNSIKQPIQFTKSGLPKPTPQQRRQKILKYKQKKK